jgi:hypothetical protein
VRYTVNFYRQRNGRFDEMRYDSHERSRGRAVEGPHFHMKVQSAFKGELDKAVEEIKEIKEIKEIVDTYLQGIEEVLRR